MKRVITVCLVAIVGLAAADASAQAPLRAPGYTVQSQAPVPTIADPAAPPVQAVPYAAPATYQVAVYRNVRVKDRRKIHPCAVPTIVEVPDPCNPCCCVCIEICAPPCECLCVKRTGLFGRKLTFDYGKYEVDVYSRRGQLVVDYDA